MVGDGFYIEAPPANCPFNPVTGEPCVRTIVGPQDLLRGTNGKFAIDFFGIDEKQAREIFPAGDQQLMDTVKPLRDQNSRPSIRNLWWKFAWDRPVLRSALRGTTRFIATLETSKHRFFGFISGRHLWDGSLFGLALEDSLWFGVLSASVHVEWALATGGTLEDRPRYRNGPCFETFPFPNDDTGLTPDLTTRIRTLAEQLDAHRKAQQAAYPDLTLTGLYNVLEKLRSGEALTPKDKLIHGQGLVSVLKSLHDDLDAAVLAAYGWQDLQPALADHTQAESRAAAVETLLERLVALNAKRAAEEATGHVRWLRPDFQQRGSGVQARMDVSTEADAPAEPASPAAAVPKRPWPSGLPEQIKAVADTLASSPAALSLADIEARFAARGRWRERLPTILDTLEALGRARRPPSGAQQWQGS